MFVSACPLELSRHGGMSEPSNIHCTIPHKDITFPPYINCQKKKPMVRRRSSLPRCDDRPHTAAQPLARRVPRNSSIRILLLIFSPLFFVEVIFWNARSMEQRELPMMDETLSAPPETEDRDDKCSLRHEWQHPTNIPTTCNLLHEMEMDKIEFIGCGGDRCGFKIEDAVGDEVVFRTPK